MPAIEIPQVYPELCEPTTGPGILDSDCPICRNAIEPDDESITHHCRNTFCAECLVTWVRHCDTENPATCPLCRAPLGDLISRVAPRTWIIDGLGTLRLVVGDEMMFSSPLAHRHTWLSTCWEEIDCNITHPGFGTSDEAAKLLFRLNDSGVRYYDTFQFPDFENTTFYIPTYPILRVVESVGELRKMANARLATSEYGQVGSWLPKIYNTEALQRTFDVDYDDENTEYLLDSLPQWYDLEGYAVWVPSEIYQNIIYAVPRARFQSYGTEPDCLFIDNNGQPDPVMYNEDVEFAKIPADMMELWFDMWEKDDDQRP